VLRVVSSRETSVGTVVNVSCPAGQKLESGHKMMTTLCSQSGDWSPHVPDCIGKQYVDVCMINSSLKATNGIFVSFMFISKL